MKLEPMSDAEIREVMSICPSCFGKCGDSSHQESLRLILTIAHERAVAAKEEHFSRTGGYERITQGKFWTHEDYLRVELLALGWPEKELP